jgi:HEAT repeat protein
MRAFVPTANSHRNLAGLAVCPALAVIVAAMAGCSEPSEQLTSSDPTVAISALRACRTEAGDEVVERVARVVARPDTRVATEAVRSLGRMRTPRAVRALVRIAHSANERRPAIRREAVVQLGRRRKNPEAVAAIEQAVQADPDPHVRAVAATSLGWQRSMDHVPLLVEVAEADADPMVQACAVSAVERLVGIRFRYDPHATPEERREALARVRRMAMRALGDPSAAPPVERGGEEVSEP